MSGSLFNRFHVPLSHIENKYNFNSDIFLKHPVRMGYSIEVKMALESFSIKTSQDKTMQSNLPPKMEIKIDFFQSQTCQCRNSIRSPPRTSTSIYFSIFINI